MDETDWIDFAEFCEAVPPESYSQPFVNIVWDIARLVRSHTTLLDQTVFFYLWFYLLSAAADGE